MSPRYVKRLSDADAKDALEVGAKAANLRKASEAGFNVPLTFVLTASAYLRMSHDLRLSERQGRMAPGELRQAILGYELPEEMTRELRVAYDSLEADSVSIRSSGVYEDLPGASYAGIYESYLGVTTFEAAVDSVKKVWASSWSERAFAYRRRLGVVNADFTVAVIVQEMVKADVSGVAFTRNPVDGDANTVVITSNYGLCEPVASGSVEPDTIVVDRESLRTLRQTIGKKEVVTVLTDAGSVEQREPQFNGGADLSLDDGQARSVAVEALKLEKCFRQPQDVEWSLVGKRIVILQTRPITGLYTREDYWMNRSAAQISLEIPIINKKLAQKKGGVQKENPKTYGWDVRIDTLGDEWEVEILPRMLKEIQQVEALNLTILSNSDLAKEFGRAVEMVGKHFELRIGLGQLLDTAMERVRRSLTKSSLLSPDHFPRLLVSLRTKDVESDERLQQLADMAREDIEVRELLLNTSTGDLRMRLRLSPGGERWWRAFSDYMVEFGHLSPARFDLASPTYREAPEVVLNTISKYVCLSSRRRGELNRKLAKERDEHVRDILADLDETDKEEFQTAFKVALGSYHIKNDRDFYFLRSLAQLRRFYLECGRRFVEESWIREPEDAFGLTVEEIEPLLLNKSDQIYTIIERSRLERVKIQGMRETKPTPGLMKAWSRNATLKGIGSSPGIVKGRANVIDSLHGFPLVQPGEILVCPAITPAWGPVLGLVGGLVTDLGGLLSHGGILAREYGIPAVVGTSIGTKIIQTGQSVLVDGTNGTVHLESNDAKGRSREKRWSVDR